MRHLWTGPARTVLTLTLVLAIAIATAVPAGVSGAPAPRARAHFLPLVSVFGFVGANLAAGAVSKAGGDAFGTILSKAGFPDAATQTLDQMRAVSAKLDRVEQSINDLKAQVTTLAQAVAQGFAAQRLNTLRQSASQLVGYLSQATILLRNLAANQYTDPTLRAEKRQELLTLIATKIKDEQSYLNDLILSPRGSDDLMHAAYAAERTGRRFWTDTDGRDAARIVDFYRDETALVLMLRVEYEWSGVKQDSTAAYIDGKRAEVNRTIDAFYAGASRIGAAFPRLVGGDYAVIDTKTRLMWEQPRLGIYRQDWLANITSYHQLPSVSQFRALVGARTNSQTPPVYLRSQGWTLATSCSRDPQDYRQNSFPATETVFWSSDISGGRRVAWAMHDDGTGQLERACVMTVREIPADERYWY